MISVRTAAAIALMAAMMTPALAGSCRYGNYGGRSTVSCEGGYYESSSGGRTHSYGFRNGGYARYPGAHLPPYANERWR